MTPFLLEIYRKYEEFIETFKYYASSFVSVGDLEAGLVRSQAFQTILQQRTRDEHTPVAREQLALARERVAFIQNLLGDPTELLAMEAEKEAPGEKEIAKQTEEQIRH